jgi:hypothetical protein
MGTIDRFQTTAAADLIRRLQSAAAPQRPPVEWTPPDIARLLARVQPAPSGRPGDAARERGQLSTAFLAGVAQAWEETHGSASGSLAGLAATTARTLLKNRAATQDDRCAHAFLGGLRAGRGLVAGAVPAAAAAAGLRLFVRQPLTESGDEQQALIAAVLDRIESCNGKPHAFRYLTGRQAESAQTFRSSFEAEVGQPFTPQAFRSHRLKLLDQADVFVNIRAGMSESSAFELSYHVFRGACTPVLFLVWKRAPIKTTLLKDLGALCDVTYVEFEHPDELDERLGSFFESCRQGQRSALPALARAGA